MKKTKHFFLIQAYRTSNACCNLFLSGSSIGLRTALLLPKQCHLCMHSTIDICLDDLGGIRSRMCSRIQKYGGPSLHDTSYSTSCVEYWPSGHAQKALGGYGRVQLWGYEAPWQIKAYLCICQDTSSVLPLCGNGLNTVSRMPKLSCGAAGRTCSCESSYIKCLWVYWEWAGRTRSNALVDHEMFICVYALFALPDYHYHMSLVYCRIETDRMLDKYIKYDIANIEYMEGSIITYTHPSILLAIDNYYYLY